MKRKPKPLPPPTMEERQKAREAAKTLRGIVNGELPWGTPTRQFLDFSRPRRGECWTTWSGAPGFACVNGRFRHDLLPGWQYTGREVSSEMIPDLEALAERGERPTEATS